MLPADKDKHQVISTLLEQAGLPRKTYKIEACHRGGNNQVFAVHNGSHTFAVKWYVHSPHDQRDRLKAEWEFLEYAVAAGIGCVPRPLAQNMEKRVALYDFIEGEKISPGDICRPHIEASADFFCALNDRLVESSLNEKALALPSASEACFSIDAHFQVLDQRLNMLSGIEPDSENSANAAALINKLKLQWRELKDKIIDSAEAQGISLTENLSQNNRCISPSDFGFHNVITRPDGMLYFIDFEYAGWDDPAKMIGDFFFQPAVPVDLSHYDWFVSKVMANMSDPEGLKTRANLLRPVFGLKWCCIMLNAFIPDWFKRRAVTNPEIQPRDFQLQQLKKAENAYKHLQPICAGFNT